MSNDRVQPGAQSVTLPKPEVKIIVNGNEIVKPGMRAFFAEDESGKGSLRSGSGAGDITYIVCTCNPMFVCDCDGYVKPTCSDFHWNCGFCTCVPVH